MKFCLTENLVSYDLKIFVCQAFTYNHLNGRCTLSKYKNYDKTENVNEKARII